MNGFLLLQFYEAVSAASNYGIVVNDELERIWKKRFVA
jgi:hypothetical protein